jgi:hypothetical protein
VSAVIFAAKSAWIQGFLLQADVFNLINQAAASSVCTFGTNKQSCDPAAP